jgi:type VI secretion system secreted protein Hcp
MRRTLVNALVAVICLGVLAAAPAAAAYEFYMKATGTKQGAFKGESTRGAWKDQSPCVSMIYEVKSPRDTATGMATGRTQFGDLTVTKEWGAASPQLFQAMVTNEVLKEVVLSFIKTDPNGQEQVYFTITLKNAVIATYRMRAGEAAASAAADGMAKHTAAYDTHELEDISFRYESITVTSTIGGTTAVGEMRGRSS